MAVFILNNPVDTGAEPVVVVEPNPDAPLVPGTYIFQLEVIDDQGLRSTPVQAKVIVAHPGPVAVIQAPEQVGFGESFTLDGRESSDLPPNTIRQYIWTLINQG